jgi:L-lactate dehydrogenase
VKVGVIGVGAVGVATVLSLIERGGMCWEIVLVDRTPERANEVATDRSDPQGRLRLLETNAQVYAQIVPKVVAAAPRAVLMVVTDPLADLTAASPATTGLLHRDPDRQSEFRVHLADRLRVRPRDVQAMVVGEHGTSEVLLWSSASVGRIPVLDLLGQDGESVERLKQQIENAIRYEPAMTSDECAALERSAAALREAAGRVLGTGP